MIFKSTRREIYRLERQFIDGDKEALVACVLRCAEYHCPLPFWAHIAVLKVLVEDVER
jgi:hypothetical protein